jgi:hypothetical protein
VRGLGGEEKSIKPIQDANPGIYQVTSHLLAKNQQLGRHIGIILHSVWYTT